MRMSVARHASIESATVLPVRQLPLGLTLCSKLS